MCAWKLVFPSASVHSGPFRAEVDLRHPEWGLHRVVLGRQPYENAQILGADVATAQSVGQVVVADWCHCDCDLVAVYGETTQCPVQVDLRWRVLRLPDFPSVQAALELVASVRTSAPQCSVELHTRSVLPAEQLWMVAAGGERTEPPEGKSLRIAEQSQVAGVLFFLPDSDLFYLEMVHPNDRVLVTVQQAQQHQSLTIDSTLLSTTVEKGVIFRARMQAALLDRTDLEQTCAGLFEEFVTADPPLGA